MAESILLGVLGKDFGDGVFKYLDPRTAACLECTFTSELVFVPLGGAEALLLSVAKRRQDPGHSYRHRGGMRYEHVSPSVV